MAPQTKRVTINDVKEMKSRGEKITMITAYDYATAKMVDKAGIPLILVGDSLGMAVLGYENTLPVTMDVMIHHCKAVVRGSEHALIVGDMPFMSYHVSTEDALRNAGRFIQEAGTQAVKLEGGVTVADKVKRIVECGIPVMGHIGLTPQSVNQLGGHLVQGKKLDVAEKLLDDAKALEQAGAFAVVLEAVPARLAALVTQQVGIPTIGIGAGATCDGQVQVIYDTLGLSDFLPKHAKQYAKLAEIMEQALKTYLDEVKAGTFPTKDNSYIIDNSVLDAVKANLK
ncbi:MAG: 3-methyl-2-oxobutanoate hydroxymethyltransferase [Dehalococcoidales bacterium]|nr:3-methyl-2-oxobutanoate hydroxymethyltransferase [Dehalococcoidales bacterium]